MDNQMMVSYPSRHPAGGAVPLNFTGRHPDAMPMPQTPQLPLSDDMSMGGSPEQARTTATALYQSVQLPDGRSIVTEAMQLHHRMSESNHQHGHQQTVTLEAELAEAIRRIRYDEHHIGRVEHAAYNECAVLVERAKSAIHEQHRYHVDQELHQSDHFQRAEAQQRVRSQQEINDLRNQKVV